MASGKRPIVTITWFDIEQWVNKLAGKISSMEPDTKPCAVVPIARGGLIPGALLAYRLGLVDMWPLMAASYKGQERGPISLHIPDRLVELQGDRYLVVDDICDTGTTLRAVRQQLPKAVYAALLSSTPDPDFWAQDSTPAHWYQFPWERGALKRPD
jgi:xanthine phosphoribosyltransferase